MAAWQKAQVASLWTGTGSDWRGALMAAPAAGQLAGAGVCLTPAAAPSNSGRVRSSSRSRRPDGIG
jgi:hypothetical protein